MNTLTDTARTAAFAGGEIIAHMESGREIRFPVAPPVPLPEWKTN